MFSMRLYLHTCTSESIPDVSCHTGTLVASWSVDAFGESATTSVVRGTLVDICIITDIAVNLTILAGKTLYLPLSFTSGPKPAFSQIVPTIDSLQASGLTTLTV